MSRLTLLNRKGGCLAAAAVAAVSLAACGSSSKSSSSSTGAATPSASAATPVSSSSKQSGKQLLAQAQATLKRYSRIPKFTAPGPKLDASKVAGKQILVVDNDQMAQELVTINQGVSAAAKAAGVHVSFFNGNDTVSTVEQGIQQGITQKVSVIVIVGVNPDLVPSSISAAKAANIPVVATTVGPTVSTPGVYGTSSGDFVTSGKLMADAALVARNGAPVTADVVRFTNPAVPEALQGINSVFSKCSTCSIVKQTTIEPGDWSTKVSSSTVALIKADPNVNTLFAVIDDTLANFMTTGVREAAATNVKVIGAQGSGAAPLAVVQQGGIFAADPGQSAEWTGWGVVDQAMRAMLGMKPGKDVTPTRYLDAASLKGVDVKDSTSVYGDAYVHGFESLWGVK